MKASQLKPVMAVACVATVFGLGLAAFADPSPGVKAPSSDTTKTGSATTPDDGRISVAAARERANIMRDIYRATLHVMHERYFHNDRAIVPARAMEDVFGEIKRSTNAEARWISASLEPMSVDHKPKTDFEKQAAAAIASGKPEVEVVEDGFYRQASAIRLTSGCVNCHQGFFRNTSTSPKFAGLVISVPVTGESNESK